jgi:hypothetical protein
MHNLGLNKEECIQALRWYDDKIESIIILFGISSRIPRENISTARELLKELKESMTSDYKKRDSREGETQMSDIEKACFLPAVHEAMTRIYVKTNSTPNQKWLQELFDIQSTFHYFLSQIGD